MRNRLSNAIRRFKRPGLSGTAAGWTQYLPNSASLTVSDYAGIAERSASTLRFIRPITDGNGFQNAAPGSRVSFTTTATSVRVSMFQNSLVTRFQVIDQFYSVGAILVDGEEVKTFNWSDGYNVSGIVTIELRLSTGSKTVTIVFPYWTGFELRKIEVNTGATVTAPSRPATKIGVCGDSITHGAIASKVTTTWAYLLAIAKNKQLVNIANGGTTAVASHGSALSGLGCDVVTYMIGYNDFVSTPQTTLANFQIAVQGWITNARAAVGSSVPIHVISPIYSPNSGGGANTLDQYRAAVLAAELAAGDANTFYIDGYDLIDVSNYSGYLRSDNIHPNDAGSARIASVLTGRV